MLSKLIEKYHQDHRHQKNSKANVAFGSHMHIVQCNSVYALCTHNLTYLRCVIESVNPQRSVMPIFA